MAIDAKKSPAGKPRRSGRRRLPRFSTQVLLGLLIVLLLGPGLLFTTVLLMRFAAAERGRTRGRGPLHGDARVVGFFDQLHVRSAAHRRHCRDRHIARARRSVLHTGVRWQEIDDDAVAVHEVTLAHAIIERHLQAQWLARRTNAAHFAHITRRRRTQICQINISRT